MEYGDIRIYSTDIVGSSDGKDRCRGYWDKRREASMVLASGILGK